MIFPLLLFLAQFTLLSELAIVPVTVTDSWNRYIAGLERGNFTLYEDKIQQPITYFSNHPLPMSVGIILDVSGSMNINITSSRNVVKNFLMDHAPNDEVFLMTFNETLRLLQDFTAKPNLLDLARTSPKGYTALYDAIYRGLEKMREAKNMRRALIIVTDGEDNRSRYTLSDIKEAAMESDVQLYIIQQKNEYGWSILESIAAVTGGKVFQPSSMTQLTYFIDVINLELRSQYILGYTPTDAKKHDIKVVSDVGRITYRKTIGGKGK